MPKKSLEHTPGMAPQVRAHRHDPLLRPSLRLQHAGPGSFPLVHSGSLGETTPYSEDNRPSLPSTKSDGQLGATNYLAPN
jgi:hypothetical protein